MTLFKIKRLLKWVEINMIYTFYKIEFYLFIYEQLFYIYWYNYILLYIRAI